MTVPDELMARLQVALGPQYRLEREVGRGGMGVVFLARDTTLDRPVAVKVVHPDLAVHSAITERFLAEARMIARLRHPNIVTVHSAGEATGLFFYVMDYVPGESLRQRLIREGRLPIADVQRIVAELADGLHAAGQAGLVHRDVKPENILLNEVTGQPMLADFGVARVIAGEASGTRTAQGVAVGTPTYMSPEQAAGEVVDRRSDLYSLGVVAYEMLAGRPPFRAESAAAVASKHLSERATPVEAARGDTPGSLAGAVARALEKDPSLRWQTGAEFQQAVLGERPVGRRRLSRLRRIVMAAGIGVVLLGAAVVTLRRDGPPNGVNPRRSLLILPFDNLRQDPAVEWVRDGSVSMLTLNLSQWTDLTVVDHERLHDLLARRRLDPGKPVGLEMARRLARDAGVWTVVLGDFTRVADSVELAARVFDVATGRRVDVADVRGKAGDDVRPLFDRLAGKLLDLSGAPSGVTTDLARVTTASLEAYRAYLQGIEELNAWNLAAAEGSLTRAVKLDSTFGLAYYKLSLTRGWIAGANDSIGIDAIRRATLLAGRLPEHDQAMIGAYHNFVEGDHARGQQGYRALLARDSTDADAWYGLADVVFHDPATSREPARFTTSLRAFKKAIALDPGYFLAYEHLAQLYRFGASDRPYLVLLPGDSLTPTKNGEPGAGLTPDMISQSIQRARAEGISSARDWLVHQPGNVHAQNALIYALSAGHKFDAALAEVDRLAQDRGDGARADLPFVRARVLSEQGDIREASNTLVRALDTLRVDAFDTGRLPYETIGTLAHGANLLAYLGKVELARRDLDLAAAVGAAIAPDMLASQKLGDRSLMAYFYQSHLYTALGAPASRLLKPIWDRVADSARRAPRASKGSVAGFAWPAALGLFLQHPEDPTPMNELQALGGGEFPPELHAMVSLEHGDSTEARRQLQQPEDTTTVTEWAKGHPQWWWYRQLITAHAWHALGEEQRALTALEGFDPTRFSTMGFDVRWLLVGQARVLRGEIYEHQGKRQQARDEYRLALSQWTEADSVLDPLIDRVKAHLAALEGSG
jgi:serine/threonine-protein kinase